jgi:hypothetical protein
LATVNKMTTTRLPLALALAAASVALLAGCSAPTTSADPTTPADSALVPTLKADIPIPTDEPTSAPAPQPGQLPEGYSLVSDDQGVLSVVLPDTWSQVDGRPFTTADGREWASILATTDSAAYPTDWSVSGLEFGGTAVDGQLPADVQTQFLTDLSTPLDQNCKPGQVAQPYDDGLYVGFYSNWHECGGINTFGVIVVAQDPQFHHFVFLRGKFVTDEEKQVAYEQIFTTFQSTQGLTKASTDDDRVFVPGE